MHRVRREALGRIPSGWARPGKQTNRPLTGSHKHPFVQPALSLCLHPFLCMPTRSSPCTRLQLPTGSHKECNSGQGSGKEHVTDWRHSSKMYLYDISMSYSSIHARFSSIGWYSELSVDVMTRSCHGQLLHAMIVVWTWRRHACNSCACMHCPEAAMCMRNVYRTWQAYHLCVTGSSQ